MRANESVEKLSSTKRIVRSPVSSERNETGGVAFRGCARSRLRRFFSSLKIGARQNGSNVRLAPIWSSNSQPPAVVAELDEIEQRTPFFRWKCAFDCRAGEETENVMTIADGSG